jgi:hypothetical protein
LTFHELHGSAVDQTAHSELWTLKVLQDGDFAAEALRGCAHCGCAARVLSAASMRKVQAGDVESGRDELMLDPICRRAERCNKLCPTHNSVRPRKKRRF